MLSSVLRSPRAVKVNIEIMRASVPRRVRRYPRAHDSARGAAEANRLRSVMADPDQVPRRLSLSGPRSLPRSLPRRSCRRLPEGAVNPAP